MPPALYKPALASTAALFLRRCSLRLGPEISKSLLLYSSMCYIRGAQISHHYCGAMADNAAVIYWK